MAAGASPARPTTCPDGEIGRHRRLKICCALVGAYRFESGSGHHSQSLLCRQRVVVALALLAGDASGAGGAAEHVGKQIEGVADCRRPPSPRQPRS
ncbi:hypothetical protein BCEP4_1120028 [Burkholderia cepacia]|nr:hypothetical protein BCEP4_1120028 [Burkholderia cepacia]